MESDPLFSLETIMALLPHRPPFLFVDRVVDLVPHKSIVAERTLRPDEPQFAGHFPGEPIMPGVLVAEALAQASGLLLGLSAMVLPGSTPATPGKGFLTGTNLRFISPARPGDVLILKATLDRSFSRIHQFQVEALAGPNTIARGSLTLAEPPPHEFQVSNSDSTGHTGTK
jgi:3-hydroxyacyl-[acyl-carrier-protein] dehydratase